MTVLVDPNPDGEWDYDDNEFEEVVEAEELDDGTKLLSAGQIDRKAAAEATPWDEALVGMGKLGDTYTVMADGETAHGDSHASQGDDDDDELVRPRHRASKFDAASSSAGPVLARSAPQGTRQATVGSAGWGSGGVGASKEKLPHPVSRPSAGVRSPALSAAAGRTLHQQPSPSKVAVGPP